MRSRIARVQVASIALGLATLALHGGAYLAMKTEGELRARAYRAAGLLWWVVLILIIAMVAGSFPVRPDFADNLLRAPAWFAIPLFGLVCLVVLLVSWTARADRRMFFASAGTIVGILGSVAVGLFPRLLASPAGSSRPSLDIYNAAAAPHIAAAPQPAAGSTAPGTVDPEELSPA